MRSDALARFFAALPADRETDPDALAGALAETLAGVTVAAFPQPSDSHWRDAVRLLKASAEKPLPAASIEAVRSWPSARRAELVSHLRKADTVLEKLANERLEDEIRDSIRRHYL
jgi:hypothetical protein